MDPGWRFERDDQRCRRGPPSRWPTRGTRSPLHTAITAAPPSLRGAALFLRGGMRAAGEGVAAIMANWLWLTPWLIFGAVLAVICYRMLRSHTSAHRRRRDDR